MQNQVPNSIAALNEATGRVSTTALPSKLAAENCEDYHLHERVCMSDLHA